jgi:D-alanyl-D-alanine carboxypeptidase
VDGSFNGTDASINAGCRTVNAQVPLYGSNRMLQTAQSALLYEVNTGTMMYAYNPDDQLYPSSFVKVMTVLIALENGNPEDILTVTETALEGFSQKESVHIKLF